MTQSVRRIAVEQNNDEAGLSVRSSQAGDYPFGVITDPFLSFFFFLLLHFSSLARNFSAGTSTRHVILSHAAKTQQRQFTTILSKLASVTKNTKFFSLSFFFLVPFVIGSV